MHLIFSSSTTLLIKFTCVGTASKSKFLDLFFAFFLSDGDPRQEQVVGVFCFFDKIRVPPMIFESLQLSKQIRNRVGGLRGSGGPLSTISLSMVNAISCVHIFLSILHSQIKMFTSRKVDKSSISWFPGLVKCLTPILDFPTPPYRRTSNPTSVTYVRTYVRKSEEAG